MLSSDIFPFPFSALQQLQTIVHVVQRHLPFPLECLATTTDNRSCCPATSSLSPLVPCNNYGQSFMLSSDIFSFPLSALQQLQTIVHVVQRHLLFPLECLATTTDNRSCCPATSSLSPLVPCNNYRQSFMLSSDIFPFPFSALQQLIRDVVLSGDQNSFIFFILCRTD